MSDSGNWETKTPPHSLSAMRRTIDGCYEKAEGALEWSVKTYELVKPVVDNMAAAQEDSRLARKHASAARFASIVAVCASLIGLACEALR